MKLKKYSYSIQNRVSERNLFRFNFCGDLQGKKILDVGCGNGWFEKFAYLSGAAEEVGIDIDNRLINEGIRTVPEAFFVCASADDLDFKDNYFNMIVMFDVLEHFKKGREERVLKECYRVLKKDGSLIMSTPNLHLFSCLLDPAWYFGHRHYSKAKLLKMLKGVNFCVERISIRGGFFYLFSMILDYLFKWIFYLENPFREFLERCEGLKKKKSGFTFIILEAKKR